MVRLLMLIAVLAFLGVAPAAGSTKPTLRVAVRAPLAVRGEHFHPGERVVVTALTGLGPRRTTVVAMSGRFTARFAVPANGCGAAFAVRATGAKGSTATLVLGEAAACIPPPIR